MSDLPVREFEATLLYPHNYPPNAVFVFGSNLAGRHGKGAAQHAQKYWGAERGYGLGLTGRAYALPTKSATLRTLPLDYISGHVSDFVRFTAEHPDMLFLVTAIGCGLAGYHPSQIAPMFRDGLGRLNIIWPEAFKPWL